MFNSSAGFNVRKYEVFNAGLRDSIRDTVRRKMESIYGFDDVNVRQILEKTRGVTHLMTWSIGLYGTNGIDKTLKWLTLNENDLLLVFSSEMNRKGEAAPS